MSDTQPRGIHDPEHRLDVVCEEFELYLGENDDLEADERRELKSRARDTERFAAYRRALRRVRASDRPAEEVLD